ncbi:MAG: hypothetical protein IIW48_04150 [Clostridia bacterium]|jgi:hypothetical protein|nr:hypothetical protein [Clostridia bacterium]
MQTEKSRFTKPKKKMDKYDRAVNAAFFIGNCIGVKLCLDHNYYFSAVTMALLAMWFLKNELLYGRMMK